MVCNNKRIILSAAWCGKFLKKKEFKIDKVEITHFKMKLNGLLYDFV